MSTVENLYRRVFITLSPLVDGMIIAASGWIAYWLRWHGWHMPVNYLLVLFMGTALSLVAFPLSGAYQSWQGRLQLAEFGHGFVALVTVGLILVLLGTLTKTSAEFSRLWMAYWFGLALLFLLLYRLVYTYLDNHWFQTREKPRKVLIIGTGKLAQQAADKITASHWPPMKVIGFVSVTTQGKDAPLSAPALGDLSTLNRLVISNDQSIDEIWIALSWAESENIRLVLDQLQRVCLPTRYVPDLSTLRLINHIPTEIAGLTVIDLNASPFTDQNLLVKAVFDRLLAALALIVVAPIMLIIALIIKWDSTGPVLFRQQRHGWDGKPIQVLKFRTMTHNAEEAIPFRQVTKEDCRVTRIGRWLRRTSLDELPQFFNVLLGDMSVVGPRPHPLELNETFVEQIDAYMQRHRVKPGITGWAQVHGFRGETNTLDKMKKRVEYDLYYIDNWSLWLDIKIILRTITMGWVGNNAY